MTDKSLILYSTSILATRSKYKLLLQNVQFCKKYYARPDNLSDFKTAAEILIRDIENTLLDTGVIYFE